MTSKKKEEDYLSKLKYLQAEFDNYKKRVEKEKAEFVKFSNAALISKLIEVYENMERAIENMKKSGDVQALLRGVEMTHIHLKDVLEKEGLMQINTKVGEKFDPFKHEAVASETREGCEENTILEEIQRGYVLNDKVVRFSKVKVSKKE